MPRKINKPIPKSPKTDPQQYKVYRMEKEAISACSYFRLSQKGIKAIVRAICRHYKLKQIRVKFADLGQWAAECHSPNFIVFSSRKGTSRDPITVTHELAHHLHESLVPDSGHEDHGPEFIACHMSILDAMRVIPVVGMRAILDKYKIRYIDPGVKHKRETLKRRISRNP